MQDENEASSNGPEMSSKSQITRRKVMKAMGAGSSIGLGSANIPSVTASTTETAASIDKVTGPELERLVQNKANKSDVINVLPGELETTLSDGEIVKLNHGDSVGWVISTRSQETVKQAGLDHLSKRDLFVCGARHQLGDNKMVVVSLTTNTGEAITYYEYEKPKDSVKQFAKHWKIEEDESGIDLSLRSASYNGSVSIPQTKIAAQTEITQSSDPCGGCDCEGPGDTEGGYRAFEECTWKPDVIDCVMSGAGCGTCASWCPALSFACVACISTFCSYALFECCGDTELDCRECDCYYIR